MRVRTVIPAAFLFATTSVAVALSACGGAQQAATNPTASATTSAAPTSTDTGTAPATTDTGTATPPTTSSAPTSTGSTAAAGGPPKPWDSMSHDEKMDYMKNTVFPAMKTEFQAFSSTDFATFTCKTCHGSGAKDGTFKMPNADLPKLDVKGGLAKDKAAHPAAFDFMMQKVKPDMAKLMGETEWSPSNPNGFGCAECHTAAP